MESEINSAEIYNFVHPEHKINSNWPVLNLISRKLATDLEEKLKTRFQFPISVNTENSSIAKYQEIFADGNDKKLWYEIALPPMSGSAWMLLDRKFVYTLAQRFFGGKVEEIEEELSPILSQTEKRLCLYFIDCLKESLPVAWNMILPIKEPVIEKTSIDKVRHSSDDQVTAVCDYDMTIGEIDFKLQIVYTHGMLEPYQKKLQKMSSPSGSMKNGFSGAMRAELMNCEIDLHAVLAATKISLAEFLELKSGDFIPLRKVETVSFTSSSKPLFEAKVGNSNGQVSASLSRWCIPGQS